MSVVLLVLIAGIFRCCLLSRVDDVRSNALLQHITKRCVCRSVSKLGLSQCPLDKLHIIDKACGTSSLEPGILTHVAGTLVEASIRAGMSQTNLCRHFRGARDQESAVPSRGRPGKMPGPGLVEHSAWGLRFSSSCCTVSSLASDLSDSASRARARLLHPA